MVVLEDTIGDSGLFGEIVLEDAIGDSGLFAEMVIVLENLIVELLLTSEMLRFLEASGNSVTEEGGSVGNQAGVTEVPVTTSSRGSLGADHR